MLLVTAPLQIEAGDRHGLNTLQYQPAKVAAMEGDWSATPGAGEPLILFGLPDMAQHRTLYAIKIPHLGSLILTHSWDGPIKGLDAFAPEDRPDAPVIFWTFRLMVGLGLLMLLLGIVGAVLRWRGRLYDQRLFLRFTVAMGPAGIVAMLAGWMTTEIGRQPWVVYGVMRTADGVSQHSALAMSTSLLIFVVVYFVVFGSGISYLLNVVAQGPDRGSDTEGGPAGKLQNPAHALYPVREINPSGAGE
jgi:cytochrome bd ubiquinol oxidase subunit I